MTISWTAVLIVAAVCIGYVLVTWAVLRRFDGSREPRRHVPILIACRRARAVLAGGSSWGRRAIALRIRGITIDALPMRGDAQGREGGCAPQEPRPAPGADLTGSLSPRQPPHVRGLNQEGPPSASAPPAEATRKATGAELRDARLDYPPSAPFAQWESDTFVGGMKAVQP